MGINATHAYEIGWYVAEIYDGIETQTDDLKLIRSLIAARKGLRILEPFCGTGRLLIPLAQDGHDLVGLDRAKPMLERARAKLAQLPDEVRARVEGTTETIWCDAPRRLVRFRRTVTITRPDNATASREWLEQKHPPSAGEAQAWVARHGFVVEAFYGDREGNPYVETSPRAIFWARKPGAMWL